MSGIGEHASQHEPDFTDEEVPDPSQPDTRYAFSSCELRSVMAETGTSEVDLGTYLRNNRGYGSRAQVRKWLLGEVALTQDAIEFFPPKMRVRWAERALDRARQASNAAPLPPSPLDSTLHEGAEHLVAALKLHDKFMKDPRSPGLIDEREAPQMDRVLAKCRNTIDRASRDLSVFAQQARAAAGGVR